MAINSKGKITKAQLSQSLIDELLAAAGSNSGGGSVAIKKYSKTITTNTDRVFIGNSFFTTDTDQLLVFKNSVYLELNEDYILNQDDCTISPLSGVWEATTEEPDTFNFICLMNAPGDVLFSGAKLYNGTVTEEKLSLELQAEIKRGAVAGTRLVDGSVTGNKLSNNTITEDKLSPEVQEKLNTRGGSGGEDGVFHSYIETISTTGWSSTTNTDGMYTKTVTHGLNCNDNLIVSAIDTDTKRNIAVSYKVTGLNTIEVESDKKVNMKLMIINSNEAEIVGGTPSVAGEDLYSKTITKSMWTTEQDMMVCNINHGLNTKNVILSVHDTDTGLNVMVSYKIVDNNTIQLRSNESYNCKVVLTYKTITNTVGSSSSVINDNVVSTESTYSSEKINNELIKVNSQFSIINSKVDSITINVSDFGAKGDGVTDDTSTIQRAFNYASENKYSKIIFKKTNSFYKITSSLVIPSNVEIDFNDAKIKFTTNTDSTILYIKNRENITLNNINLLSEYINTGTGFLDGSLCSLVTGIRIINSKNIKINNYNSDYLDWGFKVDGGGDELSYSENIYINNINITNTWNPMYLAKCGNFNGNNIVLKAFTTQNGYLNGVYINGKVNGFYVNNLTCEDISGTAIGCKNDGNEYEGNTDIYIKNFKVKNVRNSFTFSNTENVIIDGFSIDNSFTLLSPYRSKNIKIINGIAKNLTNNVSDFNVDCENILLENIQIDCSEISHTFCVLPRGKMINLNKIIFYNIPDSKFGIYNNNNDIVNNCMIKNCEFIYPNGAKVPINIRSTSNLIIDDCYFENTNSTYAHVCANTGTGRVLMKNCIINGYSAISTLVSDTTIKYNNFDFKNKVEMTS